MDGGTCAENTEGSCPGDDDFVPGESEPPEYFFGHAPQVEARLTVPANYGEAQDESAPALPDWDPDRLALAGRPFRWRNCVSARTARCRTGPRQPRRRRDRLGPAQHSCAHTVWLPI